ncbi:MAG: glycosyltransferase family A protein [Candidatus Omnitrophota bacterium]
MRQKGKAKKPIRKIAKLILERLGLLDMARRLKHRMCLAYNCIIGPTRRSCRYLYSYLRFIISRRDALRHDDKDRRIISLLCPTRGRPWLANRLISSVYKTAAFPERIEILFYIDSNDDTKSIYMDFFSKTKQRCMRLGRCEFFSGEPSALVKAWNILARESRGEVLVIANDDQVYVDYGWDVRLDEEVGKFPDLIFCMWFNDGDRGGEFCSFPIVGRRWVEAAGYLSPDTFGYIGTDPWIMNIAHRIGRLHHIPDVLVEHLHVSRDKAPPDETYRRRSTPADVEKTYQKTGPAFDKTEAERIEAANRLRQAIEDYKNQNR